MSEPMLIGVDYGHNDMSVAVVRVGNRIASIRSVRTRAQFDRVMRWHSYTDGVKHWGYSQSHWRKLVKQWRLQDQASGERS